MKLVLMIIKVKYIIMASYIQYKIQYKYNFSTNLDLTSLILFKTGMASQCITVISST